MLASMHGVAKSAYSVTFAGSEIEEEKDCVHLDVKHFLPKRISQSTLIDAESSTDNDDNTLGMGVWRAKSPNWTASKSPKPGDAEYGDNSDMPELALDSSNSKNEKYLHERSRSASTEKLLQSSICRDPSLSGRRNDAAASSSAHDGDCHGGKDATLHLTLPESPAPSTRNSTHDMPRSHYALKEPICVEYLPPTWDPLSDFCFPVADVPVVRLVPDNMEMWHFDEIQHLADGSNANVFLAMFNGEKVIIKMIRAEVQTDPVAVHEFDVEHGILVRVSHPNIIKIMGAGRFPRRFVVLEFLGGGTLGNILGSNIVKPALWERMFHRSTFGFFNLLLKARDLASALHYLHSNVVKGATIIHRDLKPDNVGFTSDGSLKLFDFGLCTCVQERASSCEGYAMTGNTGSLRYMAPEVALRQLYSEKVDVYSFGIMLWQMAADKVPFKGLSRDAFMERVIRKGERPEIGMFWPSWLVSLLQACWSPNPALRPSFALVIQQLDLMNKPSS